MQISAKHKSEGAHGALDDDATCWLARNTVATLGPSAACASVQHTLYKQQRPVCNGHTERSLDATRVHTQ
jgi:hypothetical protein